MTMQHVRRASRRVGVRVLTATVTAACALSASALAASSYSVHLSVPSPVKKRHKFTVKVSGSANQVYVYVFLDRRKCAASESKEAQKNHVYKHGHSYFLFRTPSGALVRQTFYRQPFIASIDNPSVFGSFTMSPTAHAGTKAGHEYACVYLISRATTVAHAHARYTVKK